MKYYKVAALKPGLIVGEKICDVTGVILLKAGDVLTSQDISYLSFLGINGVNIEDSGDVAAGRKQTEESLREKSIEKNTDTLNKNLKNEAADNALNLGVNGIKNNGFTTAAFPDETEVVKPRIKETAVDVVKDFFRRGSGAELSKVESEIETVVSQVVSDVLSQKDMITSMTKIKIYDEYTFCHSVDVGILSGIIGAKYGLGDKGLKEVITSGFLHDIGKVFIDSEIINAPRKLTDGERIKMMSHPELGYNYITTHYSFSPTVSRSVYEHHEWFNGMGYPNRKKGNEIHINSRILKAADVYNAMTTKRAYHPPYLPCEVLEYIMGRSGMEFDPEVVTVMARKFAVYPIGCEIELSDGVRAKVIKNNSQMMLRPVVQAIESNIIIDLLKDRDARNKTIVKMFV